MTVEVRSYGPSGSGAYLVPARRKGVTWLDELNAWGTGSVQVHKSDPVLVANPLMFAHGRIVKFFYEGAERFAFRVESRTTQVVSPEEQAGRWVTVSGRGVTSLLGEGVVYPEYGLVRTSGDERRFSFASKTGDWYVPAEWVAPLGVRQDADTTARARRPADWPDGAAQWIWPTSPTASLAGGEVAYFRTTLVVGTPQVYRIFATADNDFELYLDGEPVLASDPAEVYAWQSTRTFDVDLAAGSHVLAARVSNRTNLDGALNPAGFLCTVATLTSAGAPAAFVRRTEPTNWLTHPGSPGWRPDQILSTLVAEAQARDVTAVDYLTVGYSNSADSAGVAWTTTRQDIAFRIAFESCLDVATKLAESAVDLIVGPDMVLRVWQRRGTDKTATVTLAEGVSLIDHRITSTPATATRLLVRAGQGWVEAVNSAGETAHGRKEAGLQFGAVGTAATATSIAEAVFAESASPQTVVESGQMPARLGATPYVDFGVGDDVLTAGEDGALVTVRVSAIACQEDGDGLMRFTPELYA